MVAKYYQKTNKCYKEKHAKRRKKTKIASMTVISTESFQ